MRHDASENGFLPPHQPHCLGCGDRNPGSMGVKLYADGDRMRGEVTLDRRHEGAPGFAHGGAVATVLDDTLGSVLMLLRRPAVTAKLEVDYRHPAFLGRRFQLEAWAERQEGRKVHIVGEMREGDTLIAEARGLFVQVSLDHFRRGADDLPDGWSETLDERAFELPW